MILVPEAYKNHPDLESEAPELVDFYEFYSGLQEPWDGPALLIFSDGKKVGIRCSQVLKPLRAYSFFQLRILSLFLFFLVPASLPGWRLPGPKWTATSQILEIF